MAEVPIVLLSRTETIRYLIRQQLTTLSEIRQIKEMMMTQSDAVVAALQNITAVVSTLSTNVRAVLAAVTTQADADQAAIDALQQTITSMEVSDTVEDAEFQRVIDDLKQQRDTMVANKEASDANIVAALQGISGDLSGLNTEVQATVVP